MIALTLAASQGFALGASLIIAIGAQNAFVLRQGLRREQVLLVSSVCAVCDAVLIALGAGGFATMIAAVPALVPIAAWGGAAFLFAYGLRAFHAALRPGRLEADGQSRRPLSRGTALAATLAVSLLNPHVYLDTVILLGSVSAQLEPAPRTAFALGAMAASAVWFYGLGLGATRLAPLFARPAAWRVLDLVIGAVMWSIAAALAWNQLA